MSRIFLDSNILIYFVENHPIYGPRVAELLSNAQRRGDTIVTSTLAMGEVLVKPTSETNKAILDSYDLFFSAEDLILVPFGRETANIFADVRGQGGISSPDAIHLACAAWANCTLFVTHDQRLTRKTVAGIGFIVTLDNCPV